MIRPAGSQDLPFLRDMLRHAYYARWGSEADVPLERYVAGWGRPGDTALVAIDEFQPVGAAWYRLFEQDEPGYGFVDERDARADDRGRPQPPRPRPRRGAPRGAARARRAAQGYAQISLSVEPDNPALRLYEQHGFAQGRRARRRLGDARGARVTDSLRPGRRASPPPFRPSLGSRRKPTRRARWM